MKEILIIEPFYGGSHKSMIDILTNGMKDDEYELITMSAKKWPWRARCCSLYISQQIPKDLTNFKILFCSSVLSLSELIGLCPQLAKLKKICYFHENQLVYPVQKIKERDYQYGYNQITTCLAADVVLFNSKFNQYSFLDNISKFIKIMPDYRLKTIHEKIQPKCRVLYFPVDFSAIDEIGNNDVKKDDAEMLIHIVWPHRWEFDKNADVFFEALYRLQDDKINFRVSVLGECFSEVPSSFIEAQNRLKDQIKNFGFVHSKREFYEILKSSDVVVSTADHEFFGVSIMESIRAGCFPLLPNRLVYPELYPKECLYSSNEELYLKLKQICTKPNYVKLLKNTHKIDTEQFSSKVLLPKYLEIIRE